MPSLDITTFPLENRIVRENRIGPSNKDESYRRRGILVRSVAALGSCAGLVHKGDVIIAIDGTPIASAYLKLTPTPRHSNR